MTRLQELETPIDQEIVRELIELTPEDWESIVLEVSLSTSPDEHTYSHVIWSPEGNKAPIHPSEELFDSTFRLNELFARHGRRWKKATYRVDRDQDDKWRYVVDFEY